MLTGNQSNNKLKEIAKMKILWLTNVALPEANLLMKEKATPFGGWLINASDALVEQDGIELSIAYPNSKINNVVELNGEKIKFYAFPPVEESCIKKNKYLTKILIKSKPDLVHIYGTEYAHTLSMINACLEQNIKVVVSIQGLVSVYAMHYMAYLPAKVQERYTLRDFIKRDNLKQQQSSFVKRGAFEIEALQKVKHVIGRTAWDRACVMQINPDINYHFCNETIRKEFYKHKWDIKSCKKRTIFVSQGSRPIKGLHIMLKAMPLLLKHYPDTVLYVAGYNIAKTDTFKSKLKISYYGKYINELINRYNLENNIVFTGIIDEKQMCVQYLRSHIFVCPSSIENSPNSLGEAMILGVPSVASGVGGVTDLLTHKEDGFVYQADAHYMLAYYVREVFSSDELALKISARAREHAMRTHDREVNKQTTISIYNNIIFND